jgi:hypothetical protein
MFAFSDPIKPAIGCNERFDGVLLRNVRKKNKRPEEK